MPLLLATLLMLMVVLLMAVLQPRSSRLLRRREGPGRGQRRAIYLCVCCLAGLKGRGGRRRPLWRGRGGGGRLTRSGSARAAEGRLVVLLDSG